jgi:hypothetical protein
MMTEMFGCVGFLPKQKKVCTVSLPKAKSTKQIANTIAEIFSGINFPGAVSDGNYVKSVGEVDCITFNEVTHSLCFIYDGYALAVFQLSPKTFGFLKGVYGSVINIEESATYTGVFTLDLTVHNAQFGYGF